MLQVDRCVHWFYNFKHMNCVYPKKAIDKKDLHM